MRAFNCVVGIDKLCKARYKFMFWKRIRGWDLTDVISNDDNIRTYKAGCDVTTDYNSLAFIIIHYIQRSLQTTF